MHTCMCAHSQSVATLAKCKILTIRVYYSLWLLRKDGGKKLGKLAISAGAAYKMSISYYNM